MAIRHLKSAFLLTLFIATGFATTKAAVIYQYGFENLCGNLCTTASPWTGTPDVLATGLSSSSWATNYSGGFISYDGSCGNTSCQALAISHNNEPSSTTYTLTFTVNAGYTLSITDLSFWNRESATGPTTANITINGTTAVSNLALAGLTGANTGALTPATGFNNLTGTFTLVITLSGATGAAGTFRLDDFVIDGTIASAAPLNAYSVTGGGSYCLGDTGVDIGLAGSDMGVTYQLKNASHSNVGAPVSGTGSAISFGVQTAAGIYTVTATNTTSQDTAAMTGSATIVINQPPVVNLGAAVTQCGGTVTLNAGNAGDTFLWSDNSGLQTDVVSATGNYSVTVTDANTCSSTASVSVTINTAPVIQVTATNLTVCSGQPTTITASSAATSYLWSNSSTTAAITVQPATNTTYTVTGTENNCTATGSISIHVSSVLTSTTTTSICAGLSYNGHTTAGTYYDTLTSVGGCDSIVTLNLTVLQGSASSLSQTICAGQTFQGHTTSGTFTDTLTSATGCDSVVTLQLTVTAPLLSNTSQTICSGLSYNGHSSTGNYNDTLQSVNGCDSIVSLDLVVLPPITLALTHSICKYDTFMGHTTSGNYTDTLQAANGCDSLVYLQLTVNPLPHTTLYLTFDTVCSNAAAITMSGGSPAGGYYSGQGISNSQFVPAMAPLGRDTIYYNYTDSNGCFKARYEFAYTLTCTDSTDTTTGIKNISNTVFSVLPNPTQDYLSIENKGNAAAYTLNLYDLLGRTVLFQDQMNSASGKTILNLSRLPAGLYLLNIREAEGKVSEFKIVKN